MSTSDAMTFKVGAEKYADVDERSIIAHYRQRVLRKVFDPLHRQFPAPKILVVDEQSARDLGDSIAVFELAQSGIVLVENLNLKRKPFPDLEVVYLVSTMSLDRVLADWNEPISKPTQESTTTSASSTSVNYQPEQFMYRAAHLFFVSGLNQIQIDNIKMHPNFTSHCVTIADASLDFTIEEAFVAHFSSPHYIQSLLPGGRDKNALLSRYKKQLTSFLVTMDLDPVIRYQDAFPGTQSFATELNNEIDSARRDQNWKSGQPATLVILDRRSDFFSPLLFDYTYGGRVIDVFERGASHDAPTGPDGRKLTATEMDRVVPLTDPDATPAASSSSSSDEKPKSMILNDEDPFWVKYRHQFIQDALQGHETEVRLFAERPEFEQIIHRERQREKGEEDANLSESILRNTSEYTLGTKVFDNHYTLLKILKTHEERHQAREFASDQQNMIVDLVTSQGDGFNSKDAAKSVNIHICDMRSRSSDRLRLLLVHLMTQKGCDEKKKRDLIENAQLQPQEIHAIESMEQLALIPTPENKSDFKPAPKRPILDSYLADLRANEELFDLDQYRPLTYDIICAYRDGHLSAEQYPFVDGSGAPPPDSRRNHRRNWESGQARSSGGSGPLILFILGGVTMVEARVFYELKKTDSGMPPIYLVGTEFLTPFSLIDHLQEAAKY